jgi:hypothetical protein
MSRLKIHSTNIVPAPPIKAKVQPNVQLSMLLSIVFSLASTNRRRDFGGRGLLDDGENLLGFDGLAYGDFQFLKGSTSRSDDGNLHFHGFHDDHHFVFIDRVADLFFNLQYLPNHGCFDGCCQGASPFFLAIAGCPLLHGANGENFVTVPFSRVSPGLSMLWKLFSRHFWRTFGRVDESGGADVALLLGRVYDMNQT